MMPSTLIAVWQDTLQCAPPAPVPSIKVVHHRREPRPAADAKVKVTVHDADTFELARRYPRPLVMNLADDLFPGGWVADGACTQEESLFRRSNYFRTLVPAFYPIRDGEAVYSPQVTVFKDTAAREHRGLDEPFTVDLIACPGVKYPALADDGHLQAADVRRLVQKVELILQVAETFQHRTVVMGALGCGAWRCPPRDVATVIRSVLEAAAWRIDEVAFAILRPKAGRDANNPNLANDNFEQFCRVFDVRS